MRIKYKITLSAIAICIIGLILLFIMSQISYSNPTVDPGNNNLNNPVQAPTSDDELEPDDNNEEVDNEPLEPKPVIPEEEVENNNNLTTPEQNQDSEEKTDESTEPSTPNPDNDETEDNNKPPVDDSNNDNDYGIQDDVLEKPVYYYFWTNEEERDYTGRNCLFIIDGKGHIVEGEVSLLYYGKYRKTQHITRDMNNCFLEDMYSTQVESIIIDGVVYEQES